MPEDQDKYEIPLGTPQFSQTNATNIDDCNADFELDGDATQAYRTEPLNNQTKKPLVETTSTGPRRRKQRHQTLVEMVQDQDKMKEDTEKMQTRKNSVDFTRKQQPQSLSEFDKKSKSS